MSNEDSIGVIELGNKNNKCLIFKIQNNNIDEAIVKAIELLNREDFKNYNIIDLRVVGKIIVE